MHFPNQPPNPHPPLATRHSPLVTRLVLTALILLSAWLRLSNLSSGGLSHFDEGVYVIWGFAGDYPAEALYAPPLYPLLLRVIGQLTEPGDWQAQAVNGVLGSATVALVWFLGRRWFGELSGLAAGFLAACSQYHITFSRMALTDTLFTFLLLGTLGLVAEIVSVPASLDLTAKRPTGSIRTVLVVLSAGLLAGGCLNTKYHLGILPLLVGALFLVTTLLFRKSISAGPPPSRASTKQARSRSGVGRQWIMLGGATSIALLLYAPWANSVNQRLPGGYYQLIEHQLGYSVGLAGWVPGFLTVLANQWVLTGWTSRITFALLAAAILLQPGSRTARLAAAAMIASLCLAFGDAAGWLISLLASVGLMRATGPAGRLLAMWILTLTVVTPCYHPYARLSLPLIASGWIGAGAVWAKCCEPDFALFSSSRLAKWLACVTLLGTSVSALVLLPVNSLERVSSVSGLRTACETLRAELPAEPVWAYVRPPAFFYLADRLMLLGNLDSLSDAPALLLVDTAQLRDNSDQAESLRRFQDQHDQVTPRPYPYKPGVVTLLDDWGTRCLDPEVLGSVAQEYVLVLYGLSRQGKIGSEH